MNSTQHHTICFIIVSEFNQISFEIVYYPSPPPLFFSFSSCGYILFYDDADAMLVLSDYRINHFNERTTRPRSTTNVRITGNQKKPIVNPGKQR